MGIRFGNKEKSINIGYGGFYKCIFTSIMAFERQG